MTRLLFAVIFISSYGLSQSAVLPFASQNNSIELSINNTSTVDAGDVKVEIRNSPAWIHWSSQRVEIHGLKSQETSTALFRFSVDNSAPVGKNVNLDFVVTTAAENHGQPASATAGRQSWSKQIAIRVSAPELFGLFQNYPNPFNPVTTITYLLPAAGNISLKIFDILGKEVTSIVDGPQEAGFHRHEWNASNFASGVYLYQLSFIGDEGKTEVHRKKMLLAK